MSMISRMVCVMVRAGGGLCALEPREFQGDEVECGLYAGLCGKPKERLSMVVCVVQSRDYQYAMVVFVQLTKGKEVSMMMTWRERDADEENFFFASSWTGACTGAGGTRQTDAGDQAGKLIGQSAKVDGEAGPWLLF